MAKKDKEDKKEIIGEKASLFALIFIGLAMVIWNRMSLLKLKKTA